ncbi:MAG TPA: hypothetical protein VMX76_01145 [Nevskiaceae bacterium]|nr:hypothetical protein [Nevskiaceae bacterium]
MSRKKDLQVKIKRAFLFAFGLVFFLIPGQNEYLVVQAFYLPPQTRQLEFNLPMAPYPVNLASVQAPKTSARSVLVVDLDSAVVLHAENENAWVLPASTVKIMTALVSFDNYALDEILVVGKVSHLGQDMELLEGEEILVESLLYGLLVSSANDAALVLTQNYPGGEKAFIEKMNLKAQELYLNHTYFANPTGLDSDPNGNLLADYSYTTSLDLARLADWALKNPVFAKMVATPEIIVTDISGKIKHRLFNINILLASQPEIKGIKTGWTEEAGECLVSLVERNGKKIIIVVLGSQDRFGETIKLIDWIFANHRWINLAPSI